MEFMHEGSNSEIPPVTKTESSGDGGGSGRRGSKTRVGAGGDGNDDWYRKLGEFGENGPPFERSHSEQKWIAIDELAALRIKTLHNLESSLLSRFWTLDPTVSYGLAEVLAKLVLTAYVIAETSPPSKRLMLLKHCFPNFLTAQLEEICRIAAQ